jgi:hypothetical protein
MTYTIIVSSELFFGCIPDGGDVEAVLAKAERDGGAAIDRAGLLIQPGVTLTNEPAEGTIVVWQGNRQGWIMGRDRMIYEYAVLEGVTPS